MKGLNSILLANLVFKNNRKLKMKSIKKMTISVRDKLGLLQMVSETNIEQCSYENIEP